MLRANRSRASSRRARGVLWLACAWLVCFTLLPSGVAALGPGDPAPGFTLLDAYNMEHSLEALRGRVVLLAFVGYS